jgi:ABC-2 type transport system permease protein
MKSMNKGIFLLGFLPFFRKELQEWKRKRLAIALLILLPLLMSIMTVVIAKIVTSEAGQPMPPTDLTSAASSFALNSFWVLLVTILLSIGLIPKEVDGGTLAWNLTKPLSRNSFLLGKWLATTVMVWLIAIALANLLASIVVVIGLGWGSLRFNQVAIAHLVGLCSVGFWVLLSILLGLLVKDQAGVGAGAVMLTVGGLIVSTLPDERLKAFAPFYPSNTLDWAVSSPNVPKLMAYLGYMIGMAIAAKLIFDRKEFS